KEAQNYLSPLMIVCMAPAYLSFLPGVEINANWALVPIANVVLLSRELLLGNYVWSYFFITIATMTGLALLLLNRTVRFFGHETMLGGGEGAPKFRWRNLMRREPGRRAERLTPALVSQVFLIVLLGFFYVGTPLQLQNTRSGLLLTQLLIIAGIPLLALRFWGIPVGSALGLDRKPKPLAMLLVLIGAPAATLLAALVGIAQGLFMEVPESYRELMERIFAAEGGANLLTAILVFAVVPGICEEILFRGLVLRGLATRLNPLMAIAWTAVLFGAFHFDLYRLLPTMVLGFLLGGLVWLTGSLWPAILLHAANNTIAVLANNLDALRDIPWLQEGTS
ncbi:MAG TPA: type II CAAX endopeptidase family protein, partial [Candidatus Eisenbacteria bacterium]|nr:type II CAAX endopeptidase family protein [Candidatus Eisenbacteria bacterium]